MDTPIYIDTYFRVESGYDGGRMPEEKAGRFFDEVKRLFTETGFSIKENKYKDGCPEVYLGKTCLYCHPQSLSGPVLKEHMELIEKILAQGTTFRYLRTDTYGEILDLTEEEELAYYHKTHDMTIGGVFLDAFPHQASAGTIGEGGGGFRQAATGRTAASLSRGHRHLPDRQAPPGRRPRHVALALVAAISQGLCQEQGHGGSSAPALPACPSSIANAIDVMTTRPLSLVPPSGSPMRDPKRYY